MKSEHAELRAQLDVAAGAADAARPVDQPRISRHVGCCGASAQRLDAGESRGQNGLIR